MCRDRVFRSPASKAAPSEFRRGEFRRRTLRSRRTLDPRRASGSLRNPETTRTISIVPSQSTITVTFILAFYGAADWAYLKNAWGTWGDGKSLP